MPTPLRLLSIDARTFGRDRARLAKAIAEAQPDVACVHRGPHLLRWRTISAAIGRRSGLVVVGGGRPAGANLLLSSLAVDVLAVRDVRLQPASQLDAPGACLAALRLRGQEFVLVSATLIGNAAERVAQARELQAAIDRLVPSAPPTIISAQGADRPGTVAWQSLVDSRVGVAGRMFVDARIDVGEVSEVAGGSAVSPAIALELSV
ncbi:MAG TPA: hypothetical protein VKB75_16185 [Jatrophihabitans sp.]|nr:hypothetical protein [Jatrophihabitans sp.]